MSENNQNTNPKTVAKNDIEYHFDMNVHYDSNQTYRQTIRDLFFMNIPANTNLDHLDEETRDELMYDDSAINHTMKHLFDATSTDPLFQQLYDLGAATFFSTDHTIGQAVLFSYDYLIWFHPCLQSFFLHPETWNAKHEFFLRIKSKLS